MCESDKSCRDINDASHQQHFKHTCKIEGCPQAKEEWHTRYFEHEECIDIHADGTPLQIVGNWEKIKVSRLKTLINKHLKIPVAEQTLRRGDIELADPDSTCRAYGVKAGVVINVIRPNSQQVAQPPATPTSTAASAHSNGLTNSTPTSPPHNTAYNKHLPNSAFAASFPMRM